MINKYYSSYDWSAQSVCAYCLIWGKHERAHTWESNVEVVCVQTVCMPVGYTNISRCSVYIHTYICEYGLQGRLANDHVIQEAPLIHSHHTTTLQYHVVYSSPTVTDMH